MHFSVGQVSVTNIFSWYRSAGVHSCLQCRPNLQSGPKGACPDDVQGGVSNTTVLRGSGDNNGRCVQYVRPLNATGT